jgi:hypothetical protein
VANTRETGLWSGPVDGTLFNRIAAGATFRVLDQQAGRLRVFFPGDREGHAPGEAWVDAADVSTVPWPRWVRLRRPGNILSKPAADGAPLASLNTGAIVEVLDDARGNWSRVFSLGDGRRPSVEGWLEAEPAVPLIGSELISSFALTREAAAGAGPELWLKVPYRSQLDNSPYAGANCGPTVAGMILESFGVNVPQPTLRREVLAFQPNEDCNDCGVYIENLAAAIAGHGLKIVGLRDGDPQEFHRWTQQEIRQELQAGHPVLAQVFYRGLPARANSPYWGDHFIVLTGVLGDRFIFNDPVDSDGPGYSRLITAKALDFAMAESDYPYAAFSVSR